MKVAVAQMAPVFLDRKRTLARIEERVRDAADAGATLIAFGETVLPGYPIWLSRTGGARFNDPYQKRYYARYVREAVDLAAGDLGSLQRLAAERKIAVVLGVAERAGDRGGSSLFCSRVFVSGDGEILSVHRKLVPTYEERLVWSAGDGAGLRTHAVGPFRVGALNCWENWMPLARAALYADGEDLHVMLWPGNLRNTEDITRFAAQEGRTFVISASAILREEDLPRDLPRREELAEEGELIHDGGSCIAGPDGKWIVEPIVGREELVVRDLDHALVFEERQNFDPAGHYARPDVLGLTVDRQRQLAARFVDPSAT